MARINRMGDSKLWLFHADEVMLDFKFDPIISYLEESEVMIRRKGEEIKLKFKKWEKEHADNPDVPDAFDIYENEVLNHEKFPELLNNSIFLVIYSLFESHFEELCVLVGKKIGSSLHVKDLAGGNYIELCRNYLVKVVGVDLEPLNTEWAQIRKHQILRNAIAHNKGKLKKIDADLERFIENKPGVNLVNHEIYIEKISFLTSFIDLIKKYFTNMNSILAKHIYKQ
ncbi:hypothetical protein LV716_13800 [Flagellimonas sp. HMM57]|uniref:hypothetical protein n=1 Tax=unclassified Flagellimonas TaxID=2644544 RepID=UPI0013D297A4|nr:MULTISPECIES: hypothetical protein [unclassified Flagellimonas]UII75321.1 hypothetical protein LV716_13800 [Flagellimonas sp. HMM57]